MTVDIICPLYNAYNYIDYLHKSLLNQKNVHINKIHYILTESTDKTEEYLIENAIDYELIKKSSFSHSKVREKAALNSKADIVCFITQDIIIASDTWLENLIEPIVLKKAAASYSRQIAKDNNIEKYTR